LTSFFLDFFLGFNLTFLTFFTRWFFRLVLLFTGRVRPFFLTLRIGFLFEFLITGATIFSSGICATIGSTISAKTSLTVGDTSAGTGGFKKTWRAIEPLSH